MKLILSRNIFQICREKILIARTKYPKFNPKLAIVQVGDRKDSNIYIKNKLSTAKVSGITATHFKFDRSIKEAELKREIEKLNLDYSINGIIVQLPLDNEFEINTDTIINTVDPSKDVDGLTDANTVKFMRQEFDKCFIPCTPRACLAMIDSIKFKLTNRNVVMIGRSKLVGTPLANLLKFRDANVTVCHSKTTDLPEVCKKAELLIVAIGCPKYIKADWIKSGAVVIDCGINVLAGGLKQKICGDVDFEEVAQKASFISPVPGGVGPVTVSMLQLNTVEAAIRTNELKSENN